MPITTSSMRRVEVWSTWKAAGGSRQYVIPDATLCTATSSIDGTDQSQIAVPVYSASAAKLKKNTVIRIDQDDTTFDEWKITEVEEDESSGTRRATLGTLRQTDFGLCTILSRVDADGKRNHAFTVTGLTPTQIINTVILPALTSAGFGWITLGTIAAPGIADLAISFDSPASAVQRIADTAGMEWDLRRNGSSGYLIDIVSGVNIAQPISDLRAEKNLDRLKSTDSAKDQVTRIFPKGAADDNGNPSTMARARWQITAIAVGASTTDFTLVDPAGGAAPIAFDGQLVGTYMRFANGVLRLVTASNATTQVVTVNGTTGLPAINDLVQFRADGAGTDLTWLDAVPNINAGDGVKVGNVDVPDVAGYANEVKNPALRAWPVPTSLPTYWTAIGGIVYAKQNTAPYFESAGQSIAITGTADGDGVITASVPIYPTATQRFFSGYIRIWTVSGSWRVELVFATPTGPIVQPVGGGQNVASSKYVGQFESLGVSEFDAYAVGATAVQIRIVQNGTTAALGYVDAAQITQSPAQVNFVEASGGTVLWQAGNSKLLDYASGLLSFEASIADLYEVDSRYATETSFLVGARTRVTNSRLGLNATIRLTSITRNYLIPGETKLTLSSNPADFTGSIGRPKRPASLASEFNDLSSLPAVLGLLASLNASSQPVLNITSNSYGQSFKYALSKVSTPSDTTVEATTAIDGNAITSSPGTPTLAPGEILYGKVFSYSLPGGGGIRSQSFSFQLPYNKIRRDAFTDGYGAVRSDDTTGIVVNNAVGDSSGSSTRLLNQMFSKGSSGAADNLGSVPNGSGYNKTTSTYVDSSGRVNTVWRTTGADTLTADDLGGAIGVASQNKILNSGGQDGPLGISKTTGPAATSWVFNLGGPMLSSTNTTAKTGDRCLFYDSSVASSNNRTLYYQTVDLIAGRVYRLSGWVRAVSTSNYPGSDGPFLQLFNSTASFTVLDTSADIVIASGVNALKIGTDYNGGDTGWSFVQAAVRCTVSGTAGVALGNGKANIQYFGQQYFDGVVFEEIPPDLAVGGFRGNTNLTDTGVAETADIGGILPASQAGRQAGAFFTEFFDVLPSANSYTISASATLSLAANETGMVSGRNVLKLTGGTGNTSLYSLLDLPYNPAKIYRMRCRFRYVTDASAGNNHIYFGVKAVKADGTFANTNAGNNYCVIGGEQFTASQGWVERIGWFTGNTTASTTSSGSSSDPFAPKRLNVGTTTIRPLMLANYPSGAGTFEVDYILIDEFDEEAVRRLYGTITAGNDLANGTQYTDGTTTRNIVRGYKEGRGAAGVKNAGSVTFSPAFAGPPAVILSNGASYRGGNSWGTAAQADSANGASATSAFGGTDMIDELTPYNVTASSFSARGRLRDPSGTITLYSDNMTPDTESGVGSAYALTGVTTHAPSGNDAYQMFIDYALAIPSAIGYSSISGTLVVETFQSGVWTQRWSKNYSASDSSGGGSGCSVSGTEYIAIAVTGMISTSQIRVYWKTVNAYDGSSSPSYTLSVGTAGSYETIDYYTATDSYSSKTPAGVYLDYQAIAVG